MKIFYRIAVTMQTPLFKTELSFCVADRAEINVLRTMLTEKYPDADIYVDFRTIDHVMSPADILAEVSDEMNEHQRIAVGG